ncbi:AMP-binding protein [Aeromicrobium wangtongii]|uniref:AMP-binding protein n=1 Tax=Aeromicrobium wangtongii TaxID=2969247 RepID=A0ABY5M7Z8_9ACTN|nr:AMP-binding protein [Aeromicrobium wangtongii]MCD9196770.1 AMP-binding protein [Aeromicrobium wangtongii]UUP14280.1 AMP-binding protein [Aeromicrobium wangtongii]
MTDLGYTFKVLQRIGLLQPVMPHRLLGAGLELAKWGPGLPSGVGSAAKRYPQRTAIIDDAGELTWAELSGQVNQLTQALKDRGARPGDSIAVLARNHRFLVMALVATMQLGGRVLLLNTMASRSQLGELVQREDATVVILDQEFLEVAQDVDRSRLVLAWADDDAPDDLPTVATMIDGQPARAHPKPDRHGQIIIFTSGTTGLPKGARREEPKNLLPLIAFFGSIPYRGGSTVALAAPLFHSWGLLNFAFGLSTAPTYVLRRTFDAEQVLRDIESHRAEVLVVVPLMMQRMTDVDPAVIERTDVSSLRITATSGSALAGELANRYMDLFTDSVYNFYGATETGWVTIAGPEDLREAPGTAGTPPFRTTVKILDPDGRELPQGETGVIHVGNDMPFGGYTDGNTKSFADGLMSTGDLGHFDENGRLFVSGRDDDMIISGGENVFPRELEDALIEHPDVSDVVVTGIPDERFGQVLAAYVVLNPGATLSEDEVKAYAKGKVARFAVPARTVFLDELPRNATGKVMKRELPEIEQS